VPLFEIILFDNSFKKRSYSLNYLRDSSVKGVKTYAYHLTDDIFYNSTVSPHNPTFCGITDKCLGNGVHNISKCYGGEWIRLALVFLNRYVLIN
jgi:hypothetical protein